MFSVLRTKGYMSKFEGPMKFSALLENRFPPKHITAKFQNAGKRGVTLSIQREKANHSQMTASDQKLEVILQNSRRKVISNLEFSIQPNNQSSV